MKVRYLSFIVIIFSLLWGFGSEAHAADKSVYQVGTDNLNVRSSPSYDASIVASLKQGDKVAVFQEKYGWYQTYVNGQAAWVASQYLIKTSDEQTSKKVEAATSNISVVGNGVRVRTGPGTDYKVHQVAENGERFTLIDTNGDWHKVKLPNDNTGWIASWLTDMPTTNKMDGFKAITKTVSSVSDKSLHGYNIVLDAGHGGRDPGSISLRNDKEKDLALKLTNRVADKLRSEGATVILTRSDDSYVSLNERVGISNNYWTHAFISLHFNAFISGDGHGISTHYYGGKDSNKLAQYMQESLINHTGLKNRGARQDNFFVLRETSSVAVLAELGFMTNSSDLQVITQDSYATNVANGISDGLKNYFHGN